MFEVVEHGLGVVVETGILLLPGAATGIHHASAFGTGATAGETIGDNHLRPARLCFQCRAGTCRAPANHQHIAGVVPVLLSRIGDPQGR